MSDFKFVCIDGETKGEEREVYLDSLAAIGKFLRLQLEWDLFVAERTLKDDRKVRAEEHRALLEEFKSAQFELLGRGVFENKWQARSTWALVENEEEDE